MGVRYNWQAASPIKQIEVVKNPSAKVEAIIYAPDSADERTAGLPQYMAKNGYVCFLDEESGKNVLKIVGFGKSERLLLETLRSGGFLTGDSTETKIDDKIPKLSTWNKIRKNGLNISGAAGDVGHAAMILSGSLEGDPDRIRAGALYSISATLGAVFGTGAGAIRFSEMVSDMRDYLAKEGVVLSNPIIRTPEFRFRERNLAQRTYDFVKTHPVLILNSIAIPGNLSLALSGLKEMRQGGGGGVGRLFAGTVAATSALVAMFLPEATPEEIAEYKKEKGFFTKLGEGDTWGALRTIPRAVHMTIARSPLAFQGLFMLTDNMSMLFDAYQTNNKYKVWREGGVAPLGLNDAIKNIFVRKKIVGVHQESHYKRIADIDSKLNAMHASNPHNLYDAANPKIALKAHESVEDLIKQRSTLQKQITGLERNPYGAAFSWTTGIAYTIASSFNALSTKNRDKSLESGNVYHELYTYAANAILDLPEGNQARVIKKMAEYLSAKPDVHVRALDIEKGIASKLAVIKQSPWLQNVISLESAEKTGEETVGVRDTRESADIRAKKEAKPWMEKVADTGMTATTQPARS